MRVVSVKGGTTLQDVTFTRDASLLGRSGASADATG